MSTLMQDVRFAIRSWRRNPGFAAAVALTLALGIGANTAIFSLLNAVVLRPLALKDPHRLVYAFGTIRGEVESGGMVSYDNLDDWRANNEVFEEMATFRTTVLTLTGETQPRRLWGMWASAGYFSVLGIEVDQGRGFDPGDDSIGAENVAVIGHQFWQESFGGDPDILGRSMTLDGADHAIIGVLPATFGAPFIGSGRDVWIPIARDRSAFDDRGSPRAKVVARMRPGVSLTRAQAEMDTITRRLEAQYPDANEQHGVLLRPLHEIVVGNVRPALLMLLGAVGLVLLIACVNVTNLYLAKGTSRQRELAVRAALGARRGRLIRQLITECTLLSLIGGGLGVVLAIWGLGGLVALLPAGFPRVDEITLDGRVFVFSLALTMFAALFIGLAPALGAGRLNVQEVIKADAPAARGKGRHRARGALVATEMALALVLLVGAGLLLKSFQRLTDVNPGFDPENVLTFHMSIPFSDYEDPTQRANLYGDILQRLKALPGVESAGASTTLPIHPGYTTIDFSIVGREPPPSDEALLARYDSISPEFFRTMGVPLIRGRFFSEQDTLGAPGVMIVNETMARRYWPDEDPVGHSIQLTAQFSDDEPTMYEIVGVTGDMRDAGLDVDPEAYMFIPFAQQTWPFMAFAVKTAGDPSRLIEPVRGELAALTSDEAPFTIRTMQSYLDLSVGGRRVPMLLLGSFALAALVLAAIGIYGVLSYSVAQRTREIGIRMAIGAERSDVLKLVMRQSLRLTLIGLGVGVVIALGFTRVLKTMLFEVNPADPLTYVAIATLLIVVASLATLIPARRAMKVDPMVALRHE